MQNQKFSNEMEKNKNLLRKFLHIVGGALIPILIYFSAIFYELKLILLSIIFIGVSVIGIILILEHYKLKGKNFYTKLTEPIRRKKEKIMLVAIYYSIAVIIISILAYFEFLSFIAYICGLLIFGICDGTSTIFGILYGRHKIFYNKDKSYEGSFAFFVFAVIIGVIFFRSFEKVILIALFSTFIESLPKVDDNFTLPIFTTLFIEVLV